MAKFFVNGNEYELADDKKVMGFLRDELKLLSVKDGCAEGACGACTVLVDNVPTKVCVQTAKRMEGKHIITVEGLTDREKDVFKYAFGKAQAVQCGFCIPGMVMCAKALIDKNNKQYKELYNNVSSIVDLVEFKNAIDESDVDRADTIFLELKELGLEHEKSVMYNQAVLYEKKGEWKNALNAFNYYLKQYPGDEGALHEIEFINAQLGNVNN